jgi:hypothetical protein
VIQVIRHGEAVTPAPRAPIVRHAVVARGSAGAIVSCLLAHDRTEITAIERFSYAVAPIVTRVAEIRETDPPCQIVVDKEGLGDAIWELLGKPHGRIWRLYDKHGLEREELTRVLLVAVARKSFRFAKGVWEQDAMRKALLTLTRNVREDGPGSELAVALSLALDDHRPSPPRIG